MPTEVVFQITPATQHRWSVRRIPLCYTTSFSLRARTIPGRLTYLAVARVPVTGTWSPFSPVTAMGTSAHRLSIWQALLWSRPPPRLALAQPAATSHPHSLDMFLMLKTGTLGLSCPPQHSPFTSLKWCSSTALSLVRSIWLFFRLSTHSSNPGI